MYYIIRVKYKSNQNNKKIFPDRGREGLFLRVFGEKISVEDIQKIVNTNKKLIEELKNEN